MDNKGYALLIRNGIFDMMTMPQEGDVPGLRTWVYLITLGDVQIVTAPGELFPEVFYGVETHRRTDCPRADTGRAPELPVRERMKAKYKLIFGLCPDEFGYLVPGYDFMPPVVDLSIAEIRESEDPCKSAGVPAHYHETNSASSNLAPSWACLAAALAEGKPPEALCTEK